MENSECFAKYKQSTSGAKFKWGLSTSNNGHHDRDAFDMSDGGGKFLSAYVTGNYKRNEFAEAAREMKLPAAKSCFAFRYSMNDREGCDVVRLTVTADCGSKVITVLKESGSTNGEWRLITGDLVGSSCLVSISVCHSSVKSS